MPPIINSPPATPAPTEAEGQNVFIIRGVRDARPARWVTKPYEFIEVGAMDATKPCEFIRCGAMDVTRPYEFRGFGATLILLLVRSCCMRVHVCC